ncbi:MAG: hypothetical protein ABI904_13165 [Chloroflexota bacterium]
MHATTFEITGRKRSDAVSATDIKDFELRERGQINAEEILANKNIALYALDFEKGQSVFVETASPAELSQAPFYYQAQYESAVRVITLPFEGMLQLAQSATVDDSKLIFIQSVGRCGSTLASKIFAQLPGVINMSEPDVLTQLVAARFMQPNQQDMLKMLLDACIRLLCKTPVQTAWVIKGRSWVIELGDWLHEFYPRAKNLYLYRDAESWIKSSLSAFVDDKERTPAEILQFEAETRGWMQVFVPSIARYESGRHLSGTGLLTLMWQDNLGRYTELHNAGIEMLAIPYQSWKLNPRQTASSMLDYCGCRPEDLTVINETLMKDSQEGSAISQDTLKKKTTNSQFFDSAELSRHLQNHAYIKTADFEAANTLKL